MKMRKLALALGLVLGFALPAAAATGPTAEINGTVVQAPEGAPAPHIHNDRLFVPAESFAALIGGTYSEEGGVAIIRTGKGIPNLAELQERNPKLGLYKELSPFIPGMGIHRGVEGPHVTLAVSKEGTLNAFEAAFPASAGWFPWFDQPEGQPMELPGIGKVYTQHIYVTDPRGLVEHSGVPVILDGRYLSYPFEPKPHRHNGKVYIPLRPAVELLGGTVEWHEEAYTAKARLTPGPLTWEQLKALNPKLAAYKALSPFIPNMGIHWGVEGPHVTIMVDSAGLVTGAELMLSAGATPWMPWFDQPEGQPTELPGLGKAWTQHVYIVDPASIK